MVVRNPLRRLPQARAEVGWLPLAACCLGTFLLLLYTSIVTVALPSIGAGLDAGFAAQQWVIDVYTLALAGLLLGAGAIGDAYGSRRIYLAGLVGFTLATLACGLAVSPGWLIAARAAQGVAGAAMFATILPLIGLTYAEPRRKATAFAIWGAVAGAASAVGTVCGGILTEYAGWRWLFLGALPLCALALVLAARCLPHLGATTVTGADRPRMDWAGIVLASVAVTALAYAVIEGGEAGWGTPGSIAGWAVAGCAGIGFVRTERRCPHPILPPALITTPRFVAVLLAAFGYYFAAFGALPALATWMQTGLGLASLSTALVLVIQLVVFVAVSGLLSRHLHGVHPAWTLGGGTILVGLGAATGTVLPLCPRWPALLPFLVLSGFGAGVVSPVLPALAIASAPDRCAGAASSAANAVRQLGLALGVAVCGTLAHGSTSTSVSYALAACAVVGIGTGALAGAMLRRIERFRESSDEFRGGRRSYLHTTDPLGHETVAAERKDEIMAATTTAPVATARPTTTTRRWNKAIWVAQILLGAIFIFAALPKLGGQKAAVDDFAKIGLGQWFRYLTALCELSGGIGLMVPRLSGAAASGLVGVMVGATVVNLLILGPAIAVVTVALGVVFFFLARYRWNEPHSLAAAVVRTIRR